VCCWLHFAWVVDDAKCIVVTRICVSVYVCVCLSAAVRPHYCTDPDVTSGRGRGCPPSCALLGGFAIGARVALLWQHNTKPSYNLASSPQYDDIVRTAGWAGSVCVADRRRGAPKTAHRIWQAGVAGPLATSRRRGAFSTLLRQSGMRASTGGILATKSERKNVSEYMLVLALCLVK